jgi:large subunit ribosomal protein L3
MKFLIGKKQEMTQLFAEDGTKASVTKIVVSPCFVTIKKDMAKDGYRAVQLATVETSEKHLNKAIKGFFAKVLNKKVGYRHLKEFRLDEKDPIFDKLNIGNELDATVFEAGDIVDIQGTSKGRGFQGVVKRHGFKGGKKSHGHKDQLRMPGSIGATGPARVFKGKKMAGQMGDRFVTMKNLEIIKVDDKENSIYVKGAVPGARNGLLYIVGQGEFEVKNKVVAEEPVVKEVPKEEKKETAPKKEAAPKVEKEQVKVEEKKTETQKTV